MRRGESSGGAGWSGVGCHPTPKRCVEEFTALTVEAFLQCAGDLECVRIVDICAGDGRLGYAVAEGLRKRGFDPQVTFVEVDGRKARHIRSSRVVHANAFEWHPPLKFDLVIANPPYVALNVQEADALGLPWDVLRGSGRNLYRLAIQKALDVCADGGLVSVLAPFGWIKSEASGQFRKSIKSNCARIEVWAHRSRRLFPNVNQDTAVQLFFTTTEPTAAPAAVRFGFIGDDSSRSIVLERKRSPALHPARWEVGVGPVVWNRARKRLRRSGADSIPLIYGANIRHTGELDFDVEALEARQYLKQPTFAETLRGPAIVVRRTLRGRPGAWIVDAAYVPSGKRCAAENHSIYVRSVGSSSASAVRKMLPLIVKKLALAVGTAGSPNLTVAEVTAVIAQSVGRRAVAASAAGALGSDSRRR